MTPDLDYQDKRTTGQRLIDDLSDWLHRTIDAQRQSELRRDIRRAITYIEDKEKLK